MEPSKLTPKQLNVAKMMAFGYTSKEISTATGRSIKTVEKHRAVIYWKLGCNSIPVMLRLMLRLNQITVEEFLKQTNGENSA